ncbi:uncharacterized protein LOC119378700 [Rhipicephalus sanguineus]|uniref:uncharacterized protein LOC119378700 n=1 Tax=Rhipicephalus sanguineus TaxID=34632 RepID=UPI0020C56A27|nr:uncharacterized protein LOC119378700 [Rhipicephalus sanguineus]
MATCGYKVVSRCEKLLLQARILETKATIKRLENEVFFSQRTLERVAPTEFHEIVLHSNGTAAATRHEREKCQEKKFVSLLDKYQPPDNQAGVCNLSSHHLDAAELHLLSRGLNFNTGTTPSMRKMVCSVEEAVRQVEPALQSEARTRAIGALSKLRNARTSSMSLLDKEAMKRLQNNKSIVILPADKGNATVVMNRDDYVSKMTEHLQDETTYSKIDRDPTRKIESELQKLLTDVFKFVPPEKKHLYNRLLCHTGSAPAIYGLPKVHKPNVPLRPIVDYTRSPLHSLSGYLHDVLRPLVGRTSTYVKDSVDFVDKIRNVTLDSEEIMVSFDVKSMFTRIPVDYAVDCCRSALKNDDSLPARTPLEADDVCRLLDFCLRNTYFSFNGSFYKQVFGTAMGASVSVSCANIALEALEEEALATVQPAPKLFLRQSSWRCERQKQVREKEGLAIVVSGHHCQQLWRNFYGTCVLGIHNCYLARSEDVREVLWNTSAHNVRLSLWL